MFDVVFVNSLPQTFVASLVECTGASLGYARDEAFKAVYGFDSFIYDSLAVFVCAGIVIDEFIIDLSHESDLFSIFLYELRNIVGVHRSLPYIDTHLDHFGNYARAPAVCVVDYQFYAVVVIIPVDLLVWLEEQIVEH